MTVLGANISFFFKKLDHVLYNVDWRLNFTEGFARVFSYIQCDHHPIIVMFQEEPTNPSNPHIIIETTLCMVILVLRCKKLVYGGDLVSLLEGVTTLMRGKTNTFSKTYARVRKNS